MIFYTKSSQRCDSLMCALPFLPDSFLSLSVDREDFSSCPYVLLIRSVALLTKSMHSEYSSRPFDLIRSPVSLNTFIGKLSDTQYFHIFIVQATGIVATHAFNTPFASSSQQNYAPLFALIC